MKKILLFLFLVLGVFSFAAPSYVDLNKIQRDGYQIDVNDNESLAFSQEGSEMNLVVTMYFTNDGNPQTLRVAFKTMFAPAFGLEYTDEIQSNRAYIQKSFGKNRNGIIYGYNIVPKRQKRKGCFLNVFLISSQELPDKILEEAANTVLNEIESYIK
ncbi:hypothetical protein [Fusobacterium periodonticum]|uniref:Uncharacterized protein n=1 Tax=Fusobacterium periodonticum ATCC 33693 TaxID=546275 RepID=D4CTC4_9FUSO|nr:hypothetical protein [Fusobacterium periodonticum]EFE87353.1 hypothetical protein FUSPEROL_00636 [Fusobacterium periodonticum ATCC 33693]